jgi:hypothetical protein
MPTAYRLCQGLLRVVQDDRGATGGHRASLHEQFRSDFPCEFGTITPVMNDYGLVSRAMIPIGGHDDHEPHWLR